MGDKQSGRTKYDSSTVCGQVYKKIYFVKNERKVTKMLDWLINIPCYMLAIYMFGVVLYFGTKKGGEDE